MFVHKHMIYLYENHQIKVTDPDIGNRVLRAYPGVVHLECMCSYVSEGNKLRWLVSMWGEPAPKRDGSRATPSHNRWGQVHIYKHLLRTTARQLFAGFH